MTLDLGVVSWNPHIECGDYLKKIKNLTAKTLSLEKASGLVYVYFALILEEHFLGVESYVFFSFSTLTLSFHYLLTYIVAVVPLALVFISLTYSVALLVVDYPKLFL